MLHPLWVTVQGVVGPEAGVGPEAVAVALAVKTKLHIFTVVDVDVFACAYPVPYQKARDSRSESG